MATSAACVPLRDIFNQDLCVLDPKSVSTNLVHSLAHAVMAMRICDPQLVPELLAQVIRDLVPEEAFGVQTCTKNTLGRIVDLLGQVDFDECRLLYDYACLEANFDDLEDYAFMDQVQDLASMKRSILANANRFHAWDTMLKAMERALRGFVSILFVEEQYDGQRLFKQRDCVSTQTSEYILVIQKSMRTKEYGLVCMRNSEKNTPDALIHFTNIEKYFAHPTASLQLLSSLILPSPPCRREGEIELS
jgi:hypothetical protein